MPAAGFEITVGIEGGIANELPYRAMKLVGPAPETGNYSGAAAAAIFCRLTVGDETELRNGVGRWLHDLIRKTLVGGAEVVVVQAVEQEVIRRASEAVTLNDPSRNALLEPNELGERMTPVLSSTRSE